MTGEWKMVGWIRRAGLLFSVAMVCFLLFVSCGPKPSGEDASPINVLRGPTQEMMENPKVVKFSKNGYEGTISLKASYTIRGVVVGREKYSGGWQSTISPCDIAICWGSLVMDKLYKQIQWSQHSRWYFWKYGSDFAYDNPFIAQNSSNNHIIPATPVIGDVITKLPVDREVELEGFLADVAAKKGEGAFRWNSSVSRNDTGDGSCEIIYVTRIKVNGKIYR